MLVIIFCLLGLLSIGLALFDEFNGPISSGRRHSSVLHSVPVETPITRPNV